MKAKIDLHRHCRHVVHFNLAWNPAVLEQRTGRADRIGSKTFRERSLASAPTTSYLDIGVPYLAGTYDERMYEELRLRAQTFEVLTGGDLASDEAEGYDDNAVELSDIMPSEMPGDAVRKQQHAVSPSHPRHWTGPDSKYPKLREILDKVWAEEARTSSPVETPASESELARLRPPASHSAVRRSHSSWDRLEA